MATLVASKEHVAITCGQKTLVLKLKDGNCNAVLEPPNLYGRTICVEDSSKDSGDSTSIETPAHVVLASFSSCGTWLALCSNNKQLSLWNTADWSLISNRCIVRTASSVKFTPSGSSILVADKSGDAYTYSVINSDEKGVLILGHLSMLLDILVTPTEEYIITCDRDEKIRISHFPNGYNINTYCLGHEQFVSCIGLLSHDMSILISSSGDGTIKFWDYLTGKLNHTLNCSDDLSLQTDDELANNNTRQISPVKCFTSFKVEDNKTVLCACLSGFPGTLVYHAYHDKVKNKLNSTLLQIIMVYTEPWDLLLTEAKYLWILSSLHEDHVQIYSWDECSGKYTAAESYAEEHILFIRSKSNEFRHINPPSGMTAYYKRKYDNVQVYLERKKLRTSTASLTQSLKATNRPEVIETDNIKSPS